MPWAITSLLVHKLIGFDFKLSILFGAVVVVTGPTVIVPMLRTVRLNKRIADILRWEGIVIDPLAFLIIIGTVVLQGTTSKYVAGWLGVRDPAPSGFLVVGGGRVGRMLAIALHEQGIRVLVADSDWENISQARMEGLETYFGNPVSEHADRYLDLSGIGKVISLSGSGCSVRRSHTICCLAG